MTAAEDATLRDFESFSVSSSGRRMEQAKQLPGPHLKGCPPKVPFLAV